MIEGVELYPLRQIPVPKGDVWHVIKKTDGGFSGFGEAYITHIGAGQVKGWKRHNRYTLNLVVLHGAVTFVLYDDRKGSATCGCKEAITLSPSGNYARLTVPCGIWMAFKGAGEEEAMLMDIIPEVHDPAESDSKALEEIAYNF